MAHKPFHLFKRPTKKKGKFVHYVQFFNDDGERLTARSTGQTSKAAAATWAVEQIRNGTVTEQKNITFGQYAQEWWIRGWILELREKPGKHRPTPRTL